MSITTKKLEITFVIVYIFTALVCCLVCGMRYLLASFFGALVSVADWFLIKIMAYRWVRKTKFSFFQNVIRYAVVGLVIFALFLSGLNPLGIIAGLSVVPVSIAVLGVFVYFKKDIVS